MTILDVGRKTCQGQWTIGRGGERGPGISVLMVRHDDVDDDTYWQHFFIDTYLIEHNKHFLST